MNSKSNPLNTFHIMEKQVIVAEMVQSNKSMNQVWFVHVTGTDSPEQQGYCKSAFKAMRLAFVLKQRSGIRIADSSLQLLRQLSQMAKPQVAETEQPAEPQQEEEKPKRRNRRAKKQEAAA